MKKHVQILPVQPVSEIELVYRSKVPAATRELINSSEKAADVLRHYFDETRIELQEQFLVMYLNAACKALGIYRLSTGGISATIADVRLILAAALRLPTSLMILAHCHPSGNLRPSASDVQLTRKVADAAALLEMKLVDHLIFGAQGFYSMADEGDL